MNAYFAQPFIPHLLNCAPLFGHPIPMLVSINMIACHSNQHKYCRTHNVRVCLYIANIACGSASLYIKTLLFFCTFWRCQRRLPSLTYRYAMMRKLPNSLYLGHASYMCSTVNKLCIKSSCLLGLFFYIRKINTLYSILW